MYINLIRSSTCHNNARTLKRRHACLNYTYISYSESLSCCAVCHVLMKNETKQYCSVGGLSRHHLKFSIIHKVKDQPADPLVKQNDVAHWKLDIPLMTTLF